MCDFGLLEMLLQLLDVTLVGIQDIDNLLIHIGHKKT